MTASGPQSYPGSTDGPDGEGVESTEAVLGEYTWESFVREHDSNIDSLEMETRDIDGSSGLLGQFLGDQTETKTAVNWERTEFDPVPFLGFHPDETGSQLTTAAGRAAAVWETFRETVETTPVAKDEYGWEQFKWEYHYDEGGRLPRDSAGQVEPFEPSEYLGFDPTAIDDVLDRGVDAAEQLADLVDERTVDVNQDLAEDEFFSTREGHTTMVNRYDLEKTVPMPKKRHLEEVERYWVDKPHAFVVIFHSTKENEKKYYLVDPYLDDIEEEVRKYIAGKLRTAIRYADENVVVEGSSGRTNGESPESREAVIEQETRRLLARYDVYEEQTNGTPAAGENGDGDGDGDRNGGRDSNGDRDGDRDGNGDGVIDQLEALVPFGRSHGGADGDGGLDGIEARPEPAILAENPDRLTEYQAEKLLYRLKRDFLGYERIDGIKHDIQVEDISCDGYNSPVFVYHTEYEQLITNVEHGETQLDNFVIKLAQRSGKGISKRRPQVDATLPDGSRAQLTLGHEVSDHGTNYTIRQFNDVPFTPVDLINWNTFSLDEMAFLWLCIESEKSVMFGGGTASGKTTSLNAVSLFIPSNAKIVSIEDTREVELPQRNWVASVTRPSFTDDDQGDIDEFDLLEAALRQRPEYIVMGEVRGEEGRTLFQVMSTGHTTLTTFHADSVDEVLKRFTTDPINVSKTMFTALDIVSIQTQTRVKGRKVRRNRVLTDVNYYETDNDEINVQDVYKWQPESDEFLHLSESNNLQDIMFDRGWDRDRLESELFKRRVVLAYLVDRDLNTYAEVAATIQAFINDPDTILTLMARDQLEESLRDLREMESVLIDVNPEKEALVPRPEPTDEKQAIAAEILDEAEERLFEDYVHRQPSALVSALPDAEEAATITPDPDDSDQAAEGGAAGRSQAMTDGARPADNQRSPAELPPEDPSTSEPSTDDDEHHDSTADAAGPLEGATEPSPEERGGFEPGFDEPERESEEVSGPETEDGADDFDPEPSDEVDNFEPEMENGDDDRTDADSDTDTDSGSDMAGGNSGEEE